MAKKKKSVNQDAINENVNLIGEALMDMVADHGVKKAMGISRVESVALSYGLSSGVALGYLLATDKDVREAITGVDDTPITKEESWRIAGHIMLLNIEMLPEHRDCMLSIDKHTPKTVTVTVKRQKTVEVR